MYNAARIIAIALLTFASWWSVRLARADHAFRTGTPESVERAVELLPHDASYLLFQAQQQDYDGRDPRPTLEQAAAASPLSSAPLIRLGLDAESRGDFTRAESELLRAASVDHQFEPAWTLANFYFRRGDKEKFWPWARTALQVSYGDRRLLFDLCWQVSSDPGEIFRRAVPPEHDAIAAYVSDLVYVHQHPEALKEPALALASSHNPNDGPLLLAATNSLIAAHRITDAADLQSAFGESRPNGITHPDFEGPRTGQGFDWRWPNVPGITHTPVEGGHRITFDGRQPEVCELLRQTLAAAPGKYTLEWESRTQGLRDPAGLRWNENAAVTASDDWRPGQAQVVITNEDRDVVLIYRRPQGEPRIEGWLELRHVRLVAR